MKKHITIIFLILSAAMIFTACNKEDNGLVTLNVEITNYTGNSNTKMYVDENRYTHWTSGDQVAINGNGANKKFTVDLTGNKAKIAIPTTASDTCYLAVYPASIAANNYTSKASSISITLPSSQTYSVVNGKQIINAPMYAYCAQGSNSLTFHNLCSLLKVTVQGRSDEDIILQNITVTSNNKGLSGGGTIYSPKSVSPYLSMSSSNKSVSLDFTASTETLSQGTSKSYYIVIPPFTSNTNITITTEAIGSNEMKKVLSTTSVTLAANLIVSGPTIYMTGATVIFSGDGTEDSPFLINDLSDLTTLKDRVNAGYFYNGKHFKLMNNISCGSWSGIGMSSSYLFQGIFDGDNKTITYTQTNSGSYCGLFKHIGTATVKKLKVHCTINNAGAGTYAGYCGGIAGYSYGTTFEDDTVITGSSISGSGRWYGGITGYTENAAVTITRCHSYANIESTQTNNQLNIGGIVGYVKPSGSRVDYCSASGTIQGTNGDYIGGIVGSLNSGCTVDNCTFTGTVTGKDGATYTNNFVGYSNGTVTNCPPAK